MQVVLAVLKWIGIVVGVVAVVFFVLVVFAPPLTRGSTDRWGATKAEADSSMAGDALVAEAQQKSTRAITIKAPAPLIYALVKQMGYGRGGWYAWDWFYRWTGSADFVDGHHTTHIDPALQTFGLGDTMYLFPGAGLTAVVADPPRALVLYKKTDDATGKMVPPEVTPEKWSDMTWAWIVRPQTDGTTRLILRTRSGAEGQSGFMAWLWDKPLELGGAIFGYKTLAGIKRTAEKLAAAGVVVDNAGVQTVGPVQ